MTRSTEIKHAAQELRKKGFSLIEISRELGIAKSTASLWVKSIELDFISKEILATKTSYSLVKASIVRKAMREAFLNGLKNNARSELHKLRIDNTFKKVLLSVLYWTEGGKRTTTHVTIINSDPEMIKVFLDSLRSCFSLDESKLRALVHIHEYHNNDEVRKYWSSITKIPLSQFTKSYLKPHTGKRIREGYQGSIRINYYDYRIVSELKIVYNELIQRLGV